MDLPRDCEASFARYQAVCVVADEARFADRDVMACFVSYPLSYRNWHGFAAPLQVMPELHIDLQRKPIGARLLDALTARRHARPRADPLQPTWEVIESLHHALQSVAPAGLASFRPAERLEPGVPAKTSARELSKSRPLLTLTTDQGSPLFACVLYLLQLGFRLVWFPDPNHQESNDALNVSMLCGLSEHRRKLLFLSKFNHGPWKNHAGGRWKQMQQASFDMTQEDLWMAGSPEERLFQFYYRSICRDLDIANPDAPQARFQVLDHIQRVARRKGSCGSTSRWFSQDDTSLQTLRNRYTRMFLVDVTLVLQGASPFRRRVSSDATLEDVFKVCGQSLAVVAYLLRDSHMMAVERMRVDILRPLRERHSERIKQDV